MRILKEKSTPLFQIFDERQKRLWAATEARAIGRGGIAAVNNATGLCCAAIRRGIKELKEGEFFDHKQRIRKSGGGKKNITETHPHLEQDLDQLINPATRGDPIRQCLHKYIEIQGQKKSEQQQEARQLAKEQVLAEQKIRDKNQEDKNDYRVSGDKWV
jgi:hypothetical protein